MQTWKQDRAVCFLIGVETAIIPPHKLAKLTAKFSFTKDLERKETPFSKGPILVSHIKEKHIP